jgi:hypothetical protein
VVPTCPHCRPDCINVNHSTSSSSEQDALTSARPAASKNKKSHALTLSCLAHKPLVCVCVCACVLRQNNVCKTSDQPSCTPPPCGMSGLALARVHAQHTHGTTCSGCNVARRNNNPPSQRPLQTRLPSATRTHAHHAARHTASFSAVPHIARLLTAHQNCRQRCRLLMPSSLRAPTHTNTSRWARAGARPVRPTTSAPPRGTVSPPVRGVTAPSQAPSQAPSPAATHPQLDVLAPPGVAHVHSTSTRPSTTACCSAA